MSGSRVRPCSPRAALAARERPNHIAIPPAKRAKSGPSSLLHTSESRTAHQSEARRQRAEKWYDSANKDITVAKGIPFVDNDPPFFLDESPHESNVPAHGSDASTQDRHGTIGPTAPTASLLAQMNANNALNDQYQGNDDFRSVIDDLTVQNSKLKRKLQKYERLHCAHLQKEKLFEVRIHGLPAHKKRELEHTLRSFASSMDNDSQLKHKVPELQTPNEVGSSALYHPASSSTSGSRPMDSAYASMSGVPSGQSNLSRDNVSKSTQKNVNSFLNEIPQTLMPRKSLAMSEKTKSKLIVRRMEQIFTGRGPVSHRHSQSQQQQEVSTAAADAERSRIEACGQRVWREGTREAHILQDNTDLRVDSMEDSSFSNRRPGDVPNGTDSQPRGAEINRTGSPEQRPTRPLDLDIHRAQVPSDNIEYMRRLGLGSPTDGEKIMIDGDDGWVYLNLLTSMAQLHTLNVTPGLIRKAITAFSQQLELSSDGTKVRWLAGAESSRLSPKENNSDGPWRPSESNVCFSKPRSFADLKTADDINDAQGLLGGTAEPGGFQAGVKRRPIHMEASNASEYFQYKPLFVHPSPSDEDAESGIGSSLSASTGPMEHATGVNSSTNAIHERQRRLRGRKNDSGPIIFYNRAKFCTDLGGDPSSTNGDVTYDRFTQQPVGCSMLRSVDSQIQIDDPRRSVVDIMELDSRPIPLTRSALDLDDLKTSISDCASQNTTSSPIDMEASGLGGIQPSDNFVVKVRTRLGQRMSKLSKLPNRASHRRNCLRRDITHSVPKSALDAIHRPKPIPRSDASSPPQIKSEVVSAVKTAMPPSTLPPPSCVVLPFTSSGSSDDASSSESGTDSDSNSDSNSDRLIANINETTTALRVQYRDSHLHDGVRPGSRGGSEGKGSCYDDSDDDENDSEGSIDLLAHARLQDPEAVRAKEREWEGEGQSVSVAAIGGKDESSDETGSGSEDDSMSIDEEEGSVSD